MTDGENLRRLFPQGSWILITVGSIGNVGVIENNLRLNGASGPGGSWERVRSCYILRI